MNSREKFIEIMNFNTKTNVPKWEYAYWGATINRWYNEGLPENNYPVLPTNIVTTSSSLYTAAWTHEWRKKQTIFEKNFEEREEKILLKDGIAVWAEALYWPTQGLPLDKDVNKYFGFDKAAILVNVEQLFYPRFEIKILDEDDKFLVYIDIDGITRKYAKQESTIPTSIDWPVKDWESWLKIKEERLNFDNIGQRFPKNWNDLLKEYKNRDYVLAIGGFPIGFFGVLAHILGYANLFYFYYDQPDLLKDILETFTQLWIAIWSEVFSQVDVDVVHIWEDVSAGKGSMISKEIFQTFMTPYYKKLTGFLKSTGIKNILVDTDGNCNELIPLFMEAGVTGLYPMEASAGMDVIAVRKKYPKLQIMGGIPKLDISLGKKRIDEILEPIKFLIQRGGYIPFCDHSVPPSISWANFKYYREQLNRIIDDI